MPGATLAKKGCARAWGVVLLVAACGVPGRAEDGLEAEYRTQVRPLMKTLCAECHAGEEQEGEIDFDLYPTLAEVRRGRRTWQKVREVLDKGDMPPKDAERQPTDEERRALRGWVGRFLEAEARAHAGDPGRVVLRRLSNAEYENTVRDLTGIDLRPAREFPVDGAAGEGFTNTGDALVMSPALLTKYLDAAKGIAAHAVLLPDGFRFSAAETRRDWTDEIVAEIRRIYDRFADSEGKLPLEAYLAATIEGRAAIASGAKTVDALAAERGLSPKYLAALWGTFHAERGGRGGLIEALRDRWKAAKPGDVPALAGEIRRWQAALWRMNSTGYAFDRPRQEPVGLLAGSQALRKKIEAKPGSDEVAFYLAAGDAGDGPEGDAVVWRRPRLESPGHPPMLLRDARQVGRHLIGRRRAILGATARYLAAATEAKPGDDATAAAALAARHGVEADALEAWVEYLGIASRSAAKIDGYLTGRIGTNADAVRGWGESATPNLVANASDQEAHIPGLLRPRKVAVHPSPDRLVAVGWRSPVEARVRLQATVRDADAGCGNGVTWALELRRGGERLRLAGGTLDNGREAPIAPIGDLDVRAGDLVALLVGPRDGNHACDLTEIDLELTAAGAGGRSWRLSKDVADDLLAGNPHADRLGNRDTWHFFTQPASAEGESRPAIPPGSTLARWRDERQPDAKARLAAELERLLDVSARAPGDGPDAALRRQATALDGPLLGRITERVLKDPAGAPAGGEATGDASAWGLDPSLFGKGAGGRPIDAASLGMQAPGAIEVKLPAELVAGWEFVVEGELDPAAGPEGSVQLRVLSDRPAAREPLAPGVPVLAGERARARFEAALAEFRRLFPAALCFRQIVPVDEVITLLLFFRDDEALSRLMLDDAGHARLDRLWAELRYVSQDANRMYQAFDQMLGFASQENQTAKVEAWRKPVTDRYNAFQKELAASEPKHLDELVKFAERAYRRPIAEGEAGELRALYRRLRGEELSHDEAFRLTLARAFVAPAFLYRVERPGPGPDAGPVSDWELASRLSYFLWASQPDDGLWARAREGRLREPDVLAAEARRMVRDDRVRGLASEFALQWLEVRDIDKLDEKSERHFPTFAAVRGALHEEALRFFADLFARDGSVLEIVEADHTFLNEALAAYYGIPGVKGPEWRRVDGVKPLGRGGVLGLGATLATQSGASRTSPVLRGNWVVETLLGDRLPKPPKNVPQLPDDEAATDGLTVRQLVEKHRSVAQCASCHDRIDPYGFSLEGFDAIGRLRTKDLGDRPIDVRVELKDGTKFEGVAGLRSYLLTRRKEQFVRNFCRKLLGYSLGRGVQLSDEPLLDEMLVRLKASDYRFSAALETIVRSKQFRYHRGLGENEE